MLALAHKRQGNYAEARAAFRKIARPDANVLLQLGLLSLREGQLSVAVEELARAWEMDPRSYATVYNLVMAQLSLGQFDDCRPRIATARKLAPSPEQERLLALLEELVSNYRPETPGEPMPVIMLALESPLESVTPQEEQQLIKLIRSLGQVDACYHLMRTLAAAHPRSPAVIEAHIDCVLAKAFDLLTRCRWAE